MPGGLRNNKKAMKIFYKIMKTPKNQRQDNQKKATEKQKQEWYVDTFKAQ